jgi:hypothetical protein
MKHVGGIIGATKQVDFYCEVPLRIKNNNPINWNPGIYLDKRTCYPVLIIVQERLPS